MLSFLLISAVLFGSLGSEFISVSPHQHSFEGKHLVKRQASQDEPEPVGASLEPESDQQGVVTLAMPGVSAGKDLQGPARPSSPSSESSQAPSPTGVPPTFSHGRPSDPNASRPPAGSADSHATSANHQAEQPGPSGIPPTYPHGRPSHPDASRPPVLPTMHSHGMPSTPTSDNSAGAPPTFQHGRPSEPDASRPPVTPPTYPHGMPSDPNASGLGASPVPPTFNNGRPSDPNVSLHVKPVYPTPNSNAVSAGTAPSAANTASDVRSTQITSTIINPIGAARVRRQLSQLSKSKDGGTPQSPPPNFSKGKQTKSSKNSNPTNEPPTPPHGRSRDPNASNYQRPSSPTPLKANAKGQNQSKPSTVGATGGPQGPHGPSPPPH